MPSSVSFIGAGFYVANATQLAPGTVRVKYSTTPKAVSNLGVSDALNPVNYVLSGPGPYSISSIQPVGGDPLSFDLVLAAALAVGTWTVQVSNVQTVASNPLTAPTAAQFQVTSSATLATLSGGAEDDDAEKIIRKHLNPALKGPNWDALIKALSVGDDINWNNARAGFDQLFLTTASGSYLERKAGDIGVIKPLNVGIDDEDFRRLAVKTNSNKVVHEAIKGILEVYFGQDSLRAFVEAELDERYNLSGGASTLTWMLDEKESFSHTFTSAEFGSSTAAQAVEVAFILTKAMRDAGSRGFASVVQSTTSGKSRIRIYSGSLGLGSFVRVTGGTAQAAFRFPTLLSTYTGTVSGYSWTYTHPDAETTRASLTLTSPLIDLSSVRVGDYVVIGSDAGIGITGSFSVKNVTITYNTPTNLTQTFDIETLAFTGTGVQASNSAYSFYRPTKSSTATADGRTVTVAQTQNGQVDVSIPATTSIVSRGPNQAFYGRLNSTIDVARVVRDATGLATITTATPHGLTVTGRHIQVDGVIPAPSIPYVSPGNGAAFPTSYTYAASPVSLVAESQTPPSTLGEDGAACALSNGQFLFAGGFTRAAAAIVSSTGFQASGATTPSQTANRYQAGATSIVSDATEADGATRSSHTWIGTLNMVSSREHHAISPYDTGAIVTGGMVASPFSVLNSSERYFLDSSWTALPSMSSPRTGHQQVTLYNGSVMVVGGAVSEGTATKTTEIYNGTSWVADQPMNIPRTDFQLVRLSNGNYMAIGGRTLGAGHSSDNKTLALWRMDEAAGPTSADATGTYPLTFSSPNAPAITSNGKIDRCLDFSVTQTRLSGSGNAAAQTALYGEWTLEFWHKQSAVSTDNRIFVTYGGATGAAADNALMCVGMSDAGRIFWRWERGTPTGAQVVSGSQFTWPTSISFNQQTDSILTHPIWRPDFFNHIALRKSFTAPKRVVSAKRLSNVTTLTLEAGHGFVNADSIYFSSTDFANAAEIIAGYVPFASGLFTVTAVSGNDVSFSNTGADKTFRMLSGSYAGKNFDVQLFVNGVSIQTWTDVANSSHGPSSGTVWYVAHNPKVINSGCEGFLDDMRISKVARSEEEIRSNFLKGWGHQRSLGSANQAIGAVTNTCEIYLVGLGWALIGDMSIGRAYHQAVVLPGDYVLVHGGVGYSSNLAPPITNQATVGLWPSNSLRDAEIYDPIAKRWFPVKASGARRHGHAMYYLPTAEKVLVFGGSSFNQNTTDVDDVGYPELFDVATRTWRTMPVKYRTAAGAICSVKVDDRESLLYGGFDQSGATNSKALLYIDGSPAISGPGLNGQHSIYAIPSSTEIQIQTKKTPEETSYSSTTGSRFTGADGTWNQARVGGTWNINTGSRTAGVTTLVLSFPTGYVAHDISVGDVVYINSKTGAFGGGLKTVTAVTSTGISYAEALGDQTVISVVGSVSESWSPEAGLAPVAAVAGAINDPGPYVFDPLDGLAVTATESSIALTPLYSNQNYEEVEIDDAAGQGSLFPDAQGYLVFGFGTSSQSSPVKYLGRYKSSPTTAKLTLDYRYRFTADQPVGTKVTFLSQRVPYAPVESKGSSYVTASSAGRVASQAATEETLASGVGLNLTVVYPGDRGLGGEGHPSRGAQKLSDKVSVFAGDDINQEVQENRED